ncbi:ArgK protein [Tistrella bauzanensis]|uniref:ArgK protein n=1 Tax=Tistrella bauzanensis TaxID=657419 RepID=A0ABQ1J7W0_9PROT|nr:methylmalonyl Co-A mutase-associated GTPase MeaB [Tistrella bauzanensis]GGB59955.1 ArgK protein [Tistrella bauzanensis]
MTGPDQTAEAGGIAAGLRRLDEIRAGGKPALARALARLESRADAAETADLLDAAYAAPVAQVLGITGPPGVGKSSLLSALIRAYRAGGRSVGVIAVDPSSKRTKGALLGDRTRIQTDPEDQGVFIRSMAARARLGGLADFTIAATVLMRAIHDVVLVETVGVGQSETDVEEIADTVVFCIQPASGDSLQFMKAGIMEIPDLAVVTKADIGPAAERARTDVASALKAVGVRDDGWKVPVLKVAASTGEGIGDLIAAADRHRDWMTARDLRDHRRAAQAEGWVASSLKDRFGTEGLRHLATDPAMAADAGAEHPDVLGPFHRLRRDAQRLAGRLAG